MAEILNSAGIPTFHEKNHNLKQWAGPNMLGEISGHFVMQMDPWPEARVWHFTRHPQPFVTSLLKFGFWNLHAPTIHPFLKRTCDLVSSSFRYWVTWNQKIMEIPEPRRTTFRIEDVSRDLISDLASTIGVKVDVSKINPVWNEKQDFTEIKYESEVENTQLRGMMDLLGYEVA